MARIATAIKYRRIVQAIVNPNRGKAMRLHMVAIAAGFAARVCFIQSAAPPGLEVASVKPNRSVRNGIGNRFEPQRMRWTNVPLKVLIQESFKVRPYAATNDFDLRWKPDDIETTRL
jgi:hypothetical protein